MELKHCCSDSSGSPERAPGASGAERSPEAAAGAAAGTGRTRRLPQLVEKLIWAEAKPTTVRRINSRFQRSICHPVMAVQRCNINKEIVIRWLIHRLITLTRWLIYCRFAVFFLSFFYSLINKQYRFASQFIRFFSINFQNNKNIWLIRKWIKQLKMNKRWQQMIISLMGGNVDT